MRSRAELHSLLRRVTKLNNVYYQPPSKMSYPCLRYEKASYNIDYGDDIKYKNMTRYELTVIGTNPDNDDIINALLALPYCSFDRRYKTTENLYHDVLILYW